MAKEWARPRGIVQLLFEFESCRNEAQDSLADRTGFNFDADGGHRGALRWRTERQPWELFLSLVPMWIDSLDHAVGRKGKFNVAWRARNLSDEEYENL
ncbi:MAG: hypothetical protein KGJ79_16085 [Alphaproteobacteria bacterium]|nr:hypothetical protein [Alphaproteobacteria bacterium]MDE2496063.1 hypothetical protein [Alphaproteobacteria bacterium]